MSPSSPSGANSICPLYYGSTAELFHDSHDEGWDLGDCVICA